MGAVGKFKPSGRRMLKTSNAAGPNAYNRKAYKAMMTPKTKVKRKKK